jgi:toxin-antitoxin system PIN domain toxin
VSGYLLDVNVLIALIDPAHVQHDRAHRWFASHGKANWATCPITENGVLRIVGHPRYPNSPGTPAAVVRSITGLRSLPGHQFWPDTVSLFETKKVDPGRLLDSAQITDTYLLALAQSHKGKLATFDRRLVADALIDGSRVLHIIQ